MGRLGPGAVPADYDTDGWIDIAVYDIDGADAGTWAILRGGDDYRTSFAVPFGAPDRLPFPADYDKDGWTDLGVYDTSGPDVGTWSILSGKTGFVNTTSFQFGTARHVPAPGDYDRDGFLDLAVFATGSDAGRWQIAGVATTLPPRSRSRAAKPTPSRCRTTTTTTASTISRCTFFAVRAPARGRCARREASSAR